MNVDKELVETLKGARHIVVMKLRYIGDSIWMLPFMDNLKRNLPGARITVVVNEGTDAFFHNKDSVNEVMAFPRGRVLKKPFGFLAFLAFALKLRRTRPDVVIELTDGDRPAILGLLSGARVRIGYNYADRWRRHLYTHILDSKVYHKHFVRYLLDALVEMGMEVFDEAINIEVPAEAFDGLRKKVPAVFDKGDKKKVVIHPGSRGPLRQWGAERFAQLADRISDEARVFLVAGPGEGEILRAVKADMNSRPEICTDELSLYEFAALCVISDMFIGNDSGPIHIASAKTFTVGIYGPTQPDIVGPWTARKLTFTGKDVPCRPCRQEGCEYEEYRACIESIGVEEVAVKVKEALRGL